MTRCRVCEPARYILLVRATVRVIHFNLSLSLSAQARASTKNHSWDACVPLRWCAAGRQKTYFAKTAQKKNYFALFGLSTLYVKFGKSRNAWNGQKLPVLHAEIKTILPFLPRKKTILPFLPPMKKTISLI